MLSGFSNLKVKDAALSSQGYNLVRQVFGGRVISKLRCCNYNHISDTYEPSVELSLEIEDANSLLSALESFTKVEHGSPGSKPYDPSEKNDLGATNQTSCSQEASTGSPTSHMSCQVTYPLR